MNDINLSFSTSNAHSKQGMLLAANLLVFLINILCRMRVRAGLVTVIYTKALVLSNDERTRASGDIVNLMSVDATRLQDLCTYGLIAISGPLQVSPSASSSDVF